MTARTHSEGLDYIDMALTENGKGIVGSYASVFNLFPEGLLILSEDATEILFVNDFILTLTHFTRQEIENKKFLDLFHIPDIHSFVEYFSFAVKQKEATVFELLLKSRGGQLVPIKLTISLASFEEQKFIVCSVSDRSDFKRLEVERNMLSHALKQVNEGLSVFDLDGRILFVNEAFLDTFGYAKEEIIGTSIETLFSSCGSHEFQLHILPASLKGGWNGEFKVKRKDGKEITIFLSTSTVKDDDGHPVVIVGVISDITLRKQLEEQLRHSQKMEAIGQLAGGIAHDFNNLLTVIEGYIDLLQNVMKHEGKTPTYVMQIKKATDRAVALTRQLLAFSRRQILQPKVLDINQNIRDLSIMLQRLIGENIDLLTDLDAEIWPIKADPHQIEQVIMNLIVNARDAMPDGGKLIIKTRAMHLDSSYNRLHPDVEVGDYVLLSISDTGIGMSPEIRERIFEPFFTTKEKGKGTGLGLATVYGIVKQSNGHIYVYSEEGKGTTFKIYFPAVKQRQVARKKKKIGKSSKGKGEKILVVEDEYLVRELILDTLKNLGYQVLEASNGEQALKIFHESKNEIDLILTDLIMPGMNGKQLMETITKEAPDLQFLIMSGYDDNAISKHGLLEAGINYIQKPFSPKSLGEKLQEVFRS